MFNSDKETAIGLTSTLFLYAFLIRFHLGWWQDVVEFADSEGEPDFRDLVGLLFGVETDTKQWGFCINLNPLAWEMTWGRNYFYCGPLFVILS